MAIIKCKMCGGDLNITEGMTVAECEYCGTRQTVPNVDNEKKVTLFGRANRLRLACEFDKAASVYESIVADFPEEAEAYWGLVLCRYGIEYVDDPATGKKVPTCHRSSFESILEDTDFEQACENADAVARKVYREEAKAIEEIRKGILEVSGKEQPYDIFICYKETDENGERTVDSVLAQDVYDALTDKGYRVFFSRISLEVKLGTEYEPYIFAALNSAKIMLAFGTDYEYFNAVWVKNEWSRFLKLMVQDKSKHLIPCYKDVDAYDLPKEFQKLQAQDMGKVGAVQDLLRGIDKLLGKGQSAQAAPAPAGGPTVESLLKRGAIALEDREWSKAETVFEQVLAMEPECGAAYLGLVMKNYRCATRKAMKEVYLSSHDGLRKDRAFQRARRCGDSALKSWFAELDQALEDQQQEKKKRQVQATRRLTDVRMDRKRMARLKGLVAVDYHYVVAVSQDGSVQIACKDEDASVRHQEFLSTIRAWKDITAVALSITNVLGLRTDGTVQVASALPPRWQTSCEEWRDIVALDASSFVVVGLRADGTVAAAWDEEYKSFDMDVIRGWRDIVDVLAGPDFIAGLRADGTVVINGGIWHKAPNWTDIVRIDAAGSMLIGLRRDGGIVCDGDATEHTGWLDHNYKQLNRLNGEKLVSFSDFPEGGVAGLRADGTAAIVLFQPEDDESQVMEAVQGWTDLVGLYYGFGFIVGLRADGTLVYVGEKDTKIDGLHSMDAWVLFDDFEGLLQARTQEYDKRRAALASARAQRLEELNRKKTDLSAELANLKGLFTGKRRKEIEARLAEIEAELKEL